MFSTRESLPLMTLYKSLVRSKMDYCCPVWFPTTKEEISALEGIQRSFTSRIQSLKGFSYWERLRKLKLMSAQRRRERYIIIHMWKIYTGTAPNDIKIKFHYNDRTGPQCIVPTLMHEVVGSTLSDTTSSHQWAPDCSTAFLKQSKNAAPLIVSRKHSMITSCHSQTPLQLQVMSQPIIIVFWNGQ